MRAEYGHRGQLDLLQTVRQEISRRTALRLDGDLLKGVRIYKCNDIVSKKSRV